MTKAAMSAAPDTWTIPEARYCNYLEDHPTDHHWLGSGVKITTYTYSIIYIYIINVYIYIIYIYIHTKKTMIFSLSQFINSNHSNQILISMTHFTGQ